MLSNGHGGFGKRFGETGRLKDRYRAPNRLRAGKDNFAADREAAQLALQAYPQLAKAVQANRKFLARAVRYLTGETGVRQFLDIGTGIRPRTTPTRSPSARRRKAGSSTSTTTRSCCCTPRPC